MATEIIPAAATAVTTARDECQECAEVARNLPNAERLAEVCSATADVCGRVLPSIRNGSGEDCRECAQACDQCANECDKHDFERARRCARACREASNQCHRVAAQIGG